MQTALANPGHQQEAAVRITQVIRPGVYGHRLNGSECNLGCGTQCLVTGRATNIGAVLFLGSKVARPWHFQDGMAVLPLKVERRILTLGFD